ncbi:MAG: MFS transporter [Candidatus Caldarchaeum sp.]|uniref:MFS transporter n=1 Tax=Caldiarchaeum subterraneum TaxID=311458 RepID=A0A7C4I2C3_CALS0|nr:MFS transporter [Candidatus Caldarchaeales archaeon]
MPNLRTLWTGSLLMGFALMSMMQNAPIRAVELEASFTQVGFLMGFIRNFPYVLLSVFTAAVLLRMRWSLLLPSSAIFMTVSSLLMWLADNLDTVFFSQLLMGVAMFLFFPCGESIVANSYPKNERLRAFSLFLSAVSMGFLIGSLASGALASILGLQNQFLISAAVSSAAAPVLAKANPANPEIIISRNKHSLKSFEPIIYAAPYFIVLASAYAVLPGYLVREGLTELDVGVLFFLLVGARVLTSYVLSRLEPARVKLLLSILSILTTLWAIVLIYLPPSAAAYAILMIPVGATVSIAYVYTLYRVSGGESASSVFLIGIFEALIGICFLVGPVVAGFLADLYGFYAVLLFFSLSMLIGAFLAQKS